MGSTRGCADRGGVAGGLIVGATQSAGSSVSSGSPAASSASTTSACPVTSVADKVIPSVVTIAASGPGGSGTGSGEFIRSDGYTLTNNHVISIAAASGGSVEVLFSDGQTAPATITGRDPQTDLAAEQAGLPEGLYVQAVTPGGPAATAGLRPDDVITKIDGEPATSNLQLEELSLTKKPGDTVPIDYTRNGQSTTVTVTLAAQP